MDSLTGSFSYGVCSCLSISSPGEGKKLLLVFRKSFFRVELHLVLFRRAFLLTLVLGINFLLRQAREAVAVAVTYLVLLFGIVAGVARTSATGSQGKNKSSASNRDARKFNWGGWSVIVSPPMFVQVANLDQPWDVLHTLLRVPSVREVPVHPRQVALPLAMIQR